MAEAKMETKYNTIFALMFGKTSYTDDHANVRQMVFMIFLYVVLLFQLFFVRPNRGSRISGY